MDENLFVIRGCDQKDTNRTIKLGTVYGGGYNCETGQKTQFEGEDVGVWNKVCEINLNLEPNTFLIENCKRTKVSAHTTWILEHLSEDDVSVKRLQYLSLLQ